MAENLKTSKYLERLVLLDQLLENRNNPKTYDQMIEVLEKHDLSITERQLRDLLKLLKDQFGLEIQKQTNETQNNKKTVFFYKEKNTSLFAKNFTSIELEFISNVVAQLYEYGGLNTNQTEEILKKLNVQIDAKNNKKVIEYEQNKAYEKLNHFTFFHLFYDAIKNKTILLVEYSSYNKTKEYFVFHPYYLKQYNSRWFCLGHKENTANNRKIDIIPIDDRIEGVQFYFKKYPKDKKKKFIDQYDLNDWQSEFFNNFIGITKGKRDKDKELKTIEVYPEVERIKLLIKKEDIKTLKYLNSKPIHHSQKITQQKDQNYLLELFLIPNYELERLLLSYSDVLIVLEPKVLRDEITKRLKNSINNYK